MEEKNDKKSARRQAKELLQQFLEDNDYVELDPKASLRPCCAKAFDNFNEQTHDAWLMQCPKGMDLQQLVGKRIKLPGRRYVGDLQVRATNYETPLNEAVGYVNSSGEYALRKLPLSGLVVVSKRLNAHKPEEEGQDPLDPGSEFPAAPSPPKLNLPVRHPFFGRDYKKRIEVPAAIKKRLDEADKKSVETSAELRRTANYYTLKSEIMITAQTLEEKELEVRQSVVTGVTPKFMRTTAAPRVLHPVAPIVEIKREPEETNGHNLVKIKEEPTTPKKQKKRTSNGEILVNGTSNLQDSFIVIKDEPEEPKSQSEKRKKKKAKRGESVVIDDDVVVKQEDDDSVAEPATPKKQRKPTSNEEILVNGTSNLQDSFVAIKDEPEEPKSQPEKRKKKKAKRGEESVIIDDDVVVKQEDEDSVAEATPRKRKKLKE